MPFPRNWTEELVSEYLQLDGCLVETGHPVQIKGGGRGELNVLGFKVENDELKIIHVETGVPSSIKDLKETVEWKFDSVVRREIRRIAKRFFFGFKTFTYSPWYVSVWEKGTGKKWQKLKKEKKKEGITLITVEELMEKVENAIVEWKKRNTTKKGTEPTLPENLWLLKFLERIKDY